MYFPEIGGDVVGLGLVGFLSGLGAEVGGGAGHYVLDGAGVETPQFGLEDVHGR